VHQPSCVVGHYRLASVVYLAFLFITDFVLITTYPCALQSYVTSLPRLPPPPPSGVGHSSSAFLAAQQKSPIERKVAPADLVSRTCAANYFMPLFFTLCHCCSRGLDNLVSRNVFVCVEKRTPLSNAAQSA